MCTERGDRKSRNRQVKKGFKEKKVRFRKKGHDILRGTNKPSLIKL